MKKVIAVFDGNNFSETALNFIKHYPSKDKPLLVGVFLSTSDYTLLSSPMMAYAVPIIEDVEAVSKSISKFKKACELNNISYKVHNDSGPNALDTLQLETNFSDLLIIASELFYRITEEGKPTEHLYTILKHAECPILLLPENFNFPTETILTYDASDNSTFAIKQFSYLFPELRDNKTLLVYASQKEKEIPQEKVVTELITAHFSNCTMQKLEFSGNKYFDTWLSDQKNIILVAGGYGHKGIFSAFHKSFLSDVIKDHLCPVFIAHN